MNNIIPLMVITPLAAGFIIALLPDRLLKIAEFIAVMASVLVFFGALALYGYNGIYEIGGWNYPVGIAMSIDAFSWLMLINISILNFFILIFSLEYMKKYTSKRSFYVLFCMMVAGINGTLLAGDIFNRFVYVELTAIASYALVGFGCDSKELAAAMKYAVFGAVASSITLLGIGMIYGIFGTVNITHLGTKIAAGQPVTLSLTALFMAACLMMVGFGFKAAIMPFHIWQPDVLSSSSAPVGAMISGGFIGTVGAYAMFRTVFAVFGINVHLGWIVSFIGIISMVGGAVLAQKKENFKRFISYLSISQMGYVFLGVGLGGLIFARGGNISASGLALMGGIFHLINHLFFKPLLFLGTAAEEYQNRQDNSEKVPGRAFGLMALAGIPPFGGGISKIMIIAACFMGGHYWVGFVAVLTALFTVFLIFKRKEIKLSGRYIKLPLLIKIPITGLSVISLILALLALPVFRPLALEPAYRSIVNNTSEFTKDEVKSP